MMGENLYGQFGYGDKILIYVFICVEVLCGKIVIIVFVGYNYIGVVVESAEKGESSLYLWGCGDWGQFGNGDLCLCIKL